VGKGHIMSPRRVGITLVETLVVIGIIGILLAILIPAVQSARETARRTTCQNNLRQLAIAIENHEATHGGLPDLYYGTFLKQPRIAIDEFHFHSWRTAVLPQLEEQTLFEQIDISLPATVVSNQPNLNTSVEVFLCPSTSIQNFVVPDIREFNNGAIATKVIGTAARSDYEAIAGVNYKPSVGGSGDLSGVQFGPWGETQYDAHRKPISYRPGRFANVTDGLSNTILIGERSGRPDWYRRGEAADPYPYSNPSKGMDHHQAAWGISTHIWWLVFDHEQSINDTNATGIYSFHTAGANVGLADGSVRFLLEDIDQELLNAMATRSSGDMVTLD
jgi:prepilin-type processing-associated H-X9-DG protein